MKGQTGTPMVAHSKFDTKEEYRKWVKLKNKTPSPDDIEEAYIKMLPKGKRRNRRKLEKKLSKGRDEYAQSLFERLEAMPNKSTIYARNRDC